MKKSFIMLLCAVVVLASVALGTIAYLTDRESVTNTFTMGNVDITVDEEDITTDDGSRTEEGNEYDVEPGGEYKKDPTMTVKAGSNPAYVRMIVDISHADELDLIFDQLKIMYPGEFDEGFLPQNCVNGWDSTVWPCHAMTKEAREETVDVNGVPTTQTSNHYILEFRHPTAVAPAADADTVLPALFTDLVVPGEITGPQMQTIQGLTIEVFGHAVQTTGFDTVDAAWDAFDAQVEAEARLNP